MPKRCDDPAVRGKWAVRFMWTVLAMTLICGRAGAEHVYPFQGRLNFVDRQFQLSVKLDADAALNVNIRPERPDVYKAVFDVQNVQTPFFEMTTEIQSVVAVRRKEHRIDAMAGSFWSQYSLIDHKTVPEMSGRFDLKDGTLVVDNLLIGQFNTTGRVEIAAPHHVLASIDFADVDLAMFLDWLSGQKKKFKGSGLLSGRVELDGTPARLALKSNITSKGGAIESLAYDHMALQLQGIYPVVELTNSTITKTNGFSFDLDGTVDLSDKKNMQTQLQSIKTVPLVKETNLQSEWVLKRIQDSSENNSETKYFIKRDKGVGHSGCAGTDDDGLFGVERKIGF